MNRSIRIARRVAVADDVRCERARRVPELGPRILFFSGGSAVRSLARRLKRYTENSVHLVTPFDSGGSSALLREAFRMPAVGDLRNRLIALADETQRGNPEIYRLFSHRLPPDAPPAELQATLASMVTGESPLVASVALPMQRMVRTHLRHFVEHMPAEFDLRRASIGNLVLAGGYLSHDRDLDSVVYLFSRVAQVRGIVTLTVADDHHLMARLADGTVVVGQHLLTGKESAPITSPVVELGLVRALHDPVPVSTEISDATRRLVVGADLIVYPMGSLYSSVLANLLPRGVGEAIRAAPCPKVYVPSTGLDPEQHGASVGRAVEAIVARVLADGPPGGEPRDAMDAVLLDDDDAPYHAALELSRIADLGIDVVRLPLVDRETGRVEPEALARTLVALAG